MTEAEAKTKWCPMARFSGLIHGQSAVNRDHQDRPITACIASQCMMWRKYNTATTDGWCGLAGSEP